MKTKKFLTISFTLLMALTLAVSAALAANVHLKGGKNAEPAFYDGGLTLNASGELSGLGYEDVLVTIVAQANVTSTCTNNGGNAAPGQNPAPLTVTGSEAIPKEAFKNGNTPFDVTTIAPPSEIAGAPDCPNPNWVETIDDLAFTSAIITVEQPAGILVLTVACTFDTPTSDGSVPKNQVSCESS
jgi:hypothetical protein